MIPIKDKYNNEVLRNFQELQNQSLFYLDCSTLPLILTL